MMKANELRIGNYIELPSLAKYGVIRTIFLERAGVSYCEKSTFKDEHTPFFTFPYDVFKPITLTEEILLKCGFEKEIIMTETEGDSCMFHNENLGYLSSNFAFCINATNDYCQYDYPIELGVKMKYLHQLQNLYFALTGEELKVNI